MHRVTLVAAIAAAGYTVENPSSANVIRATRGAVRVFAVFAGRGWRLTNALNRPSRQGVFKSPHQVTEFCRSLVEPAPIFFDGEQAFRLECVGGVA